jgi:outer membrane protein
VPDPKRLWEAKAKQILTLVLLVSLPAPAFAAARSGQTLDWESCLERTAAENPELRAARSELEASGYRVNATLSPFLPQVSGAVGYSMGEVTLPGAPAPIDTDSTTLSVTATQNLFNGAMDRARRSQAQANERVQLATFEITRARVSADLKQAYAALQYSQGSIALSQDILRRREANLKLVSLRYESGRENLGSVELSKAYVAEARLDLLRAGNELETARERMGRVLGLDDVRGLEVRGPVPVQAPPAAIDPDRLAAETGEYRQARGQEDASEAAVTVARGGFFPTLDLTASKSRTGDRWPARTDRWSLGATLTIPLFHGGRDYYGTRAASSSYRAAVFTAANTLRVEAFLLKQAHARYVEAVEKLKVDQAFVKAAATRERVSKQKYNNGLLTFENWDIIENDLISRQRSLLQSERDRVAAEASWEQTVGGGAIR